MSTLHDTIAQHIVTAYNNLVNSTLSQRCKDFANVDFKWVLNSRMRTAGARASANRNADGILCNFKIEINEELFSRISFQEQLEVILHEYAHLIDYFVNNKSDGHGHIWRMIYHCIGGNGKRCHNFEVKKNVVKRYQVKDNVTGKIFNNVTTRTLNKIVRVFPTRYEIISCRNVNAA